MTLCMLLAALAMAVLFVLHEEQAGAQSWLPEVSIASQADVTEGADAVFVITASQTSSSDLAIGVNVGEWPASGSVAASADTGSKTVTIPAGQTTATLTVGTQDDTAQEPRGIITAELATPSPSAGYRVSQVAGWSTVVVSDDDEAAPSVSISAYSNANTSEQAGAVIFTLTPNLVPQQAITVNVNVTSSGDFGVKTGAHTVILPTVGDGSVKLSVPFFDDAADEADGSVTATVQAGSDYTVGNPAAATINLIDDDTPHISIAAGNDVAEGEAATFTVTASPTPYQPLPVEVYVEASGLSGVSTGTRTVNIPTSGTATLTVDTVDDNVHAQGGSVTATVQAGTGYGLSEPSSASVEVADNDGPVITIAGGAGVTEGNDATFTLTANPAPKNWISVDLTIAAAGQFGVTTGSRTVSITTTGTSTFSVSTVDDRLDEPDGSVTATIKSGYDYRVGDPSSASVAVADDDDTSQTKPVITISGGADINEGETATFTITATPPIPDGQTLDVRVDSEVPGAINILRTEQITGATTEITQFSVENNYDEADYSLSLILRASSDYTLGSPSRASVNVIDDDLPQVSISASTGFRSNLEINEDGTAKFTVSVNPVSYKDLTVTVKVTAIGAFGVPTGTRQLAIPAKTSSASFSISPVPDHAHESDGSITATVVWHSSYEIAGASSVTVTVSDDDVAQGPRLSIADAPSKARAGGKFEFSVTLSEPATGPVSVDYELGTFSPWLFPGDFQDDDGQSSGTIVFAAGEIEKVINVHIHPIAFYSHNDRIYVALDSLVGEASFDSSFATGRLNAR